MNILMIDEHPIAHSENRNELRQMVIDKYVPGMWRDQWDCMDGSAGHMVESMTLDGWNDIYGDFHSGTEYIDAYPTDPEDGHDILIEIMSSPNYKYNYTVEQQEEIRAYCIANGVDPCDD